MVKDYKRPLDNTPAAYFLKLRPKMKKSPERLDSYSPCGRSDNEEERPTWKDYEMAINQARKLHGSTIKRVVHPWTAADWKIARSFNTSTKHDSTKGSVENTRHSLNINNDANGSSNDSVL